MKCLQWILYQGIMENWLLRAVLTKLSAPAHWFRSHMELLPCWGWTNIELPHIVFGGSTYINNLKESKSDWVLIKSGLMSQNYLLKLFRA